MQADSLIIRGGNVVTETDVLPNHDIVVEHGAIAAIEPTLANARTRRAGQGEGQAGAEGGVLDVRTGLAVVDARGAYVTPGMIDTHSDYIETVASPRPGVVMDLPTSLYKCDRELVTHGITTIYHSLSVMGTDQFSHKAIREFGNVRKLAEAIADMRESEEHDHLIRHRLHLRVERDALEHLPVVEELLAAGKADLVSFMDHTPGQGQYHDMLVYFETMKGYHEGLSDEGAAQMAQRQQAAEKMGPETLAKLAALAREHGIAIASHDDDSAEKLDVMQELGATISEFPIDMQTAREAHARGMYTLAGAPNAMMGHSHSGNLSAHDGVAAGVISNLCSDYYPAALIDAVFIVHRDCGLSLPQAFALVTANPAKAAGIDDALGTLAPGKRADILLVREIGCGPSGTSTTPVVTRAFVGGSCVYRSHYPDQPQGYDR